VQGQTHIQTLDTQQSISSQPGNMMPFKDTYYINVKTAVQ